MPDLQRSLSWFQSQESIVLFPFLAYFKWLGFARCSSEVNGLLVKFRTLLAKTSKTNAQAFSLKAELFKHFFKG